MIPSFILGALIFIFILLIFQALRLTEFVLVHGVKVQDILQMIVYLSVSFLPIILPMSLLFAVLLTYGRLSGDSEIVAMKSLGLNLKHLSLPAIVLGAVTVVISAQAAFYLAPWGNRRFEVMINELGRLKASATIREGIFSEGFFDMVVYANNVDSKEGTLRKVFIFDERDPKSPLTIIAREGKVLQSQTREGNSALLRLLDGNIHRTNDAAYTKINFESYDINLFDPITIEEKKKSMLSHTLADINAGLKDPDLEPQDRRKLLVEFHRRSALAAACLIFALLGVGFGTSANRRSARGGGFAICLGIIVSYWLLYIVFENLTKGSATLPVGPMVWVTNILFALITAWSLKRASRA
ncbi:MAG: LptF/LptG family permease [Bdellovibrionaceae bacterium]|nr:LptF/LptG family permease [Bdellovibrionales bacterium]MCB9082815.1 LptF/LptG family permease [Pseudobdellovibrionaceae bacterium]